MMEERFGHIFACAPAIRQLVAYRQRVGTSLPTQHRQKPNKDFVKMRRRINLRDILWYREAEMINGKVLEARPIFVPATEPASRETSEYSEAASQPSVLDSWGGIIKGKTSVGLNKQPINAQHTSYSFCRSLPKPRM